MPAASLCCPALSCAVGSEIVLRHFRKGGEKWVRKLNWVSSARPRAALRSYRVSTAVSSSVSSRLFSTRRDSLHLLTVIGFEFSQPFGLSSAANSASAIKFASHRSEVRAQHCFRRANSAARSQNMSARVYIIHIIICCTYSLYFTGRVIVRCSRQISRCISNRINSLLSV